MVIGATEGEEAKDLTDKAMNKKAQKSKSGKKNGPAVGGISLYLLRQFAHDMGISWHSLWGN